ncbi:MAG: family 1 encapsulin nanocompartment shell protein [Methanolobus sp.]|uniref:encapsulin n=1 Tax=Methanolobus sp. TaxID=1874737 RepID=UPI00272F98CF|nr:family 1 encapsulin nanocompartment shell protein [Methanolobus sp.]MDP2217394.1 family 1 encapsulin nanocompartment shell protein [Methanolobus sp.]
MTNALYQFSRTMDTKIHPPLRQINKARKLVQVVPGEGFGETSIDWVELQKMSQAMVSYNFSTGNIDTVDFALTNSKIPIVWKDYVLDRRLYETMRRKGADVDASAALDAAYMVNSAEETMVLRGVSRDGTNYEIPGMYEGAGNDYATSKSVGTFGGIQDAVVGAYELLDADDVPTDALKWNLTMAPNIFNKVIQSRNANGQREVPELLDLLNGGNIYKSGAFGSGTALLSPTPDTGSQYVDFYLSQEVFTEHGIDSKHPDTGPIYGRVYEAGVLRIKKNVVLCKMSALTTA